MRTVPEGSDLGMEVENGEWKTVVYDSVKKGFVVPNGSIGFRWEEGTGWNLNMEDSATGANIDPLLSYSGENDGWVSADFPLFEVAGPGTRSGAVPVQKIAAGGEELVVATVFDLMTAHLGVNRGERRNRLRRYFFLYSRLEGSHYRVLREDAIRVAGEFAENAEKTAASR